MPEASQPAASRSRFRFQIGHLLLLTLAVALALGWWIDRRRLAIRNELYELQVSRLRQQVEEAGSIWASGPQEAPQFTKAQEFMRFLDAQVDWYEFQQQQKLLSETPFASEAVPLLLARLSDEDPEIRTRATSALGVLKQKPNEAVPALVPLLDDPVPNVGWHAATALGAFGAESAVALAALQVKFDDDESPIATHAGLMLRQIDPSIDIGPRLLQLADSPIRENRWRAIQAIADHVDSNQAKPILERRFETESDDEIRTMIADALNRLRP